MKLSDPGSAKKPSKGSNSINAASAYRVEKQFPLGKKNSALQTIAENDEQEQDKSNKPYAGNTPASKNSHSQYIATSFSGQVLSFSETSYPTGRSDGKSLISSSKFGPKELKLSRLGLQSLLQQQRGEQLSVSQQFGSTRSHHRYQASGSNNEISKRVKTEPLGSPVTAKTDLPLQLFEKIQRSRRSLAEEEEPFLTPQIKKYHKYLQLIDQIDYKEFYGYNFKQKAQQLEDEYYTQVAKQYTSRIRVMNPNQAQLTTNVSYGLSAENSNYLQICAHDFIYFNVRVRGAPSPLTLKITFENQQSGFKILQSSLCEYPNKFNCEQIFLKNSICVEAANHATEFTDREYVYFCLLCDQEQVIKIRVRFGSLIRYSQASLSDQKHTGKNHPFALKTANSEEKWNEDAGNYQEEDKSDLKNKFKKMPATDKLQDEGEPSGNNFIAQNISELENLWAHKKFFVAYENSQKNQKKVKEVLKKKREMDQLNNRQLKQQLFFKQQKNEVSITRRLNEINVYRKNVFAMWWIALIKVVIVAEKAEKLYYETKMNLIKKIKMKEKQIRPFLYYRQYLKSQPGGLFNRTRMQALMSLRMFVGQRANSAQKKISRLVKLTFQSNLEFCDLRLSIQKFYARSKLVQAQVKLQHQKKIKYKNLFDLLWRKYFLYACDQAILVNSDDLKQRNAILQNYNTAEARDIAKKTFYQARLSEFKLELREYLKLLRENRDLAKQQQVINALTVEKESQKKLQSYLEEQQTTVHNEEQLGIKIVYKSYEKEEEESVKPTHLKTQPRLYKIPHF